MLRITTSDGMTRTYHLDDINSIQFSYPPERITSAIISLNNTEFSVPAPRFSKSMRWGASTDSRKGRIVSVSVWYQAGDVRLTATGYTNSNHFRTDLVVTGEMRWSNANSRKR